MGWLRGTPARRRAWLVFFSLAAALGYWSPSYYDFQETGFERWKVTGFGDWQQFQHQWEASYVAIMRYGELPLWNPHHCGGVFLFGDPQAQAFSPLFWLLLPLGTTLGLKAFLALHAAAGFGGMFLYCRRLLRTRIPPALFASFCWAASGFFAWHGSGGHSAFLPFYFTPWLLMAWERAAVDLRYAAVVAAIMALTLLEGGVYPFPYFCLLLTFDGLRRMLSGDRPKGVFVAGLVAVPLLGLFGAFRLVPILDTMTRYPRPTAGSDALTVSEAVGMLTSKEYVYEFPGHEYVWAEYGAFIGWGALAIGLAGLFVALTRRPSVTLGALLFGGLMLGAFSEWSPWTLLHALPIYGSLRVPSRFAVFFLFYLALGGALLLDRAGDLIDRLRAVRWWLAVPFRGLLALLPFAVMAHIAWGNAEVLDRWRGEPIPPMASGGHHHILPWSQYGRYAQFPAQDVSSPGCYTGMTYSQARSLWTGPQAQVRVEGSKGTVVDESRTSNTLTAVVTIPEAEKAQVTFNQTWAPGWKTNRGKLVADRWGRIAVIVGPGERQRLRLWYEPPRWETATGLGLLGLLATAGVWFGLGRRRRGRSPRSGRRREPKSPADHGPDVTPESSE